MAVLPIPPTGTSYLDPRTGDVAEPWKRYLLSLETALTLDVAPPDAQYYVATANSDLTAERNLGTLTTGYLKITSAAGIATPSTVTSFAASEIAAGGTFAAINGSALTALNASNLASGTVPDARFPATLPAISGANLTNIFPSWVAVTFAGGNFLANGLMTWTVASGDQTTFRYIAIGKMVTIALVLVTTTVAGTPDTTLQIILPNSYVALAAQSWPVWITDNGTKAIGVARVAASGTTLNLQRVDGSNWSAATNATGIEGTLTLEVT